MPIFSFFNIKKAQQNARLMLSQAYGLMQEGQAR